MRIARVVLAAMVAANGLAMLIAGQTWFERLPGVAATGPYNGHLVADVGVAFLAAAVSVLIGSSPAARLAVVPGGVFLVGHAGIHLAGLVRHGWPADRAALAVELLGVYLPGALSGVALIAALRPWFARGLARVAPAEILIRESERRLGVSLDYLREIANAAPKTWERLALLQAIQSRHQGDLAAASHLAQLGAVLVDDCGDCVQIHLNLARKDGVPASLLSAALAGQDDQLDPRFAAALRFGRAIARHDPAVDEHRVALESAFGRPTTIALAFEAAAARFYPSFKRGLGVARSCQLVKVHVGP